MGRVYLPTFSIQINQLYVNIPYMDGMGMVNKKQSRQTSSELKQHHKHQQKKQHKTESSIGIISILIIPLVTIVPAQPPKKNIQRLQFLHPFCRPLTFSKASLVAQGCWDR